MIGFRIDRAQFLTGGASAPSAFALSPMHLTRSAPDSPRMKPDRMLNTAGLFAMWVAPEARGQGVGSALVEAVIAWARHENYKRILLDVADANTAAIRLYGSRGFLHILGFLARVGLTEIGRIRMSPARTGGSDRRRLAIAVRALGRGHRRRF